MKKNTPSAISKPNSKISRPQSLRVLTVEDSKDDLLRIIRKLKKGGYDPVYERVETATAMKKALQEQQWDIILCDYKLPKFNATSAIALLKETNIDIPLLIVSGTIGEETAVECMRLGAQDYIMKDNLSRLCPAIARELEEAKIRNKQRQTESALQESEEKYRNLVERANDGIGIAQDEVLQYVNLQLAQIVGLPVEELIGKPFIDFFIPEEVPKVLDRYKQRIAGKKVAPVYETALRHNNGSRIDVEVNAGIITYQGKPADLVLVRDISERKQAEKALREKQKAINAIVETSQEWIWAINPEGEHTYSNLAIEKILGYRLDEIIGYSSLDLLHEEDKKLVDSILLKARKEKRGWNNLLLRWRHKDGTFRYLESNSTVILDDEGKLIGFRGVDRDITDRIRAEETLRESEEKFRLSFENANTGVCLVDLKGNLTMVNNKMCEIFGYTKEELEHMTVNNIAHPEDVDKSPEFIQKSLHGKIGNDTFEKRYFHKKGQVVTCEVSSSLVRNTAGAPLYFISHIHNVTNRKKLEEILVKEREDLKLIIDASPIIVFYKDKEGRFIRVNKIFAEALNRREEDFVGKTVVDFYSPQIAQSMTGDDQEVFQSRRPKLNIIEQYESASGIRWVQTDKIPIFDKDGVPVGLIGFAQDITNRKRAEEELRESEENFRRSLDNSPLGICIVTAGGETIYANRAILDIYGYDSVEELKKAPLKQRYTPESYADFQIRNEKRKRGEFGPSEYEISIVRKNGEIRHVQVFRKEVIWNGTKQFQIIYQDITERKQAESQREAALEELRENEEKYRDILESIEEGYYEVDLAGNLTFFNDSVCRINGYPREELMGMNSRQYTDEYNAKKLFQAFNEVYRSEKPAAGYDYEIIKKNGTKAYIAASISLRKNETGKKIGFRGIIRDITDRKKAEQALSESEEKYRLVAETAHDFIVTADLNFKITFANKAFIDFTRGINPLRMSLLDLTPPKLRPKQQELMELRRAGNTEVFSYEWEAINDAGNTIIVDVRSQLLKEEGTPAGILVIARDITERKMAEKELSKRTEELQTIIESSPIMIYFKDTENRFLRVNKAVLETSGLTKEEIEGKSNEEINPKQATKLLEEDKEIIATGKPKIGILETIKTRRGSRILQTDKVPYKDKEGNIIGIVGFSIDITEQKKAQEELLKSEEKYRNLVENAQEGIFQSTRKGRYITLNPAFAYMLGYESPEDVMATITDIAQQLYVNPQDREKLLELVGEKGSIIDFETEFYRKDGSRIWVSVNMHAVRDDQGHILYYQGIDQDITEKKKIEAERQENIERLRKSLGATINAMAVTVETRDPYTAGHQRRVADLAHAIATEMNLKSEQIDGVRMASMIHDIGKISIPSEILTKPTQLTNLEFNLIKTHPVSGNTILKEFEFPWPIARIVLEHHERIDGSGYPNGLQGEQILLESRIIAIADVVEAISSHRPYRPAHGIEAALAEISKNKGILYDPDLVDACLRLFREKNYNMVA